MKVKSIDIKDFRGIHEMHIDFNDQVNVLVGMNGAGKSSILDILAITLSRFIRRINSAKGTGRFFLLNDIRIGARLTTCDIHINYNKKDIRWRSSKHVKAGQHINKKPELKDIAQEINERLIADEKMSLPIAIYYSVNRAVLDVPLRIRKKHTFAQVNAYDNALSRNRNDFRLFFEWFRIREDYENEIRLNYPDEENNFKNPKDYRDTQLNAVRNAIDKLSGFTNLRIRRQPLRMEASKNGSSFNILQLSDGEKCLLSMAGDLARRLAIANPGLKDPLKGEGVVLIDEIDLHLHPEWQRMIIPGLKRTFPKCQFLVSTHSPQVISHVKSESIYLLRETKKGTILNKPYETYGKNSDRILEDIMRVDSRPSEVKKQLHKLFILIDEKKLTEARKLIEKLEGKISDEPELGRAQAMIFRKEAIGK
jgi:predicted ATP-binding protein involved in virulence